MIRKSQRAGLARKGMQVPGPAKAAAHLDHFRRCVPAPKLRAEFQRYGRAISPPNSPRGPKCRQASNARILPHSANPHHREYKLNLHDSFRGRNVWWANGAPSEESGRAARSRQATAEDLEQPGKDFPLHSLFRRLFVATIGPHFAARSPFARMPLGLRKSRMACATSICSGANQWVRV